MDLSKLTPAPWFVTDHIPPHLFITAKSSVVCGTRYKDGAGKCEADMDFIALARNAFDVMMRRGWSPQKTVMRMDGKEYSWWWVPEDEIEGVRLEETEPTDLRAADPFTALVEADRWYRENVEAKQST